MRALIAFLAVLIAAPVAAAVPTQLPVGVEPVSYDLTLTPDAAKLTFAGHVAVTVDVSRAADRIVLNALNLAMSAASVDGAPARVSIDPRTQTASFTQDKVVGPGRHVLSIDYAGKIADSATGFFHVDYAGGRMLTTQFEPADARRFLPVFDEPSKKAVFIVSAIVPQDQLAVSNMPEAASEPLPGGLKRVRFQPTPKMSSYLLFFGLGDMERISKTVDGTLVSVVVRKGKTAQARYALDAAEQLLGYYNDYFGFKYPLPKLDLVAAPGDVSGSMENWGAILFSQTNVIVDPKLTGAGARQSVYRVVAHEMAHLWSGDLVTMAWWDDLWLNEGFASWMSTKATDHFHPEWRPLLSALADKDTAMRLDARNATHPIVQPVATVAQAEQAFDAITYKKGEAVIRMLEAYAGPDAWRDGVRAYVAEHAYGNATSTDLWRAIDKAAGKPVSIVARDFTTQPGVPLILVASRGAGLVVTQGPLGTETPSRRGLAWRIPLQTQSLDGGKPQTLVFRGVPQAAKGGVFIDASHNGSTQLDDNAARELLPPRTILNAGQGGYYRVAYDSVAFAPLVEGFGKLTPADQLGLLQDGLALGMSGDMPIVNYLRLTAALPVSADPLVWREQARTLAGLDGYYAAGPKRVAFRAWASGVLEPVLKRVGFDSRGGETAADSVMRETLLLALSQISDPVVGAEARRRFAAARTDLSGLEPGERLWVLVGASRSADAATFEAMRQLARTAKDPLEKQNLYVDLAAVEDEKLASQVLALTLTDEAPSNLAPALVHEVAAVHPELAWRFTMANLPVITRNLDTLGRSTFVPRVAAASNDQRLAQELQSYANKYIAKDAQGEVKVALAQIRNNADIQERRLPSIDAWIEGVGSSGLSRARR
jgi:aminopeptidase N